MLRTPDGKPRAAIVTTAHLSDEERQFVTTLVLSKLVTWMRKQSGTTDLRALLYMDEVAGYLPPTAMPPTKKPIMTLMKQARAFGVGVVLSTQNPVDVDYKALSNAGTWMIGRLQTDRDKQRLLDGMSAASGGVDVGAVGDTISGLAKREFVLKRAGKDQPEVFTTRWAMSYLRGPLTRDQIATLMSEQKGAAGRRRARRPPRHPAAPPPAGAGPRRPPPASRRSRRRRPPAAPPRARARRRRHPGDARRRRQHAGALRRRRRAVAGDRRRRPARHRARPGHRRPRRPALRRREGRPRARRGVRGRAVPDRPAGRRHPRHRRRLRRPRPAHRRRRPACAYRLTDAPLATKTFWTGVERDLVDHLVRSRTVELQVNKKLKLYSRPGETAERVRPALPTPPPTTSADAETAQAARQVRGKVTKLQTDLQAANDKAELLHTQRRGRQSEEVLSTAGSILGGLFGGRKSRKSVLGSVLGSRRHRRRPALAHRGRRRSSGRAGEQDPAAARPAGGPRAAGGRRRPARSATSGTPSAADVTTLSVPPGAQRRQRHPARAGVAPRAELDDGRRSSATPAGSSSGGSGRRADVGVEPLVHRRGRPPTRRAPGRRPPSSASTSPAATPGWPPAPCGAAARCADGPSGSHAARSSARPSPLARRPSRSRPATIAAICGPLHVVVDRAGGSAPAGPRPCGSSRSRRTSRSPRSARSSRRRPRPRRTRRCGPCTASCPWRSARRGSAGRRGTARTRRARRAARPSAPRTAARRRPCAPASTPASCRRRAPRRTSPPRPGTL